VAKRHKPVDTDYAVFSKFLKDVGAEMEKASCLVTSKDVDMTKQAEQMGLLAVSYRLGALAKLMQAGEGGKWTLPGLNPEYHLVNECVFRAAARAPLFEARTVGDVSFDPQAFMKIAFEESEAEGSA